MSLFVYVAVPESILREYDASPYGSIGALALNGRLAATRSRETANIAFFRKYGAGLRGSVLELAIPHTELVTIPRGTEGVEVKLQNGTDLLRTYIRNRWPYDLTAAVKGVEHVFLAVATSSKDSILRDGYKLRCRNRVPVSHSAQSAEDVFRRIGGDNAAQVTVLAADVRKIEAEGLGAFCSVNTMSIVLSERAERILPGRFLSEYKDKQPETERPTPAAMLVAVRPPVARYTYGENRRSQHPLLQRFLISRMASNGLSFVAGLGSIRSAACLCVSALESPARRLLRSARPRLWFWVSRFFGFGFSASVFWLRFLGVCIYKRFVIFRHFFIIVSPS